MPKVRYKVYPRVLCFVFNEDSVSMLKASEKKDWFGYYSPPGGHIEKCEDVIACAEKEIYEEIGVKVKSTKIAGIVHVDGFYGKDVMLFVTKSLTDQKQLRSSREGEAVWIKLEEIKQYKLLEDVKLMLDAILKLNDSEIFVGTSKYDNKDKLKSFNIKIK